MIGRDRRVTCEAVVELLPWYVNGTLEAAEHAMVAGHVATCRACAAELQLERQLAGAVAGESAEAIDERAGWSLVMARLHEGGEADVHETASVVRHPATVERWPVWPAVAAMAAVIALAAWWPVPEARDPTAGDFVTLTAPGAITGPALRVMAAAGVTTEMVKTRAALHGLAVADGPSAGGVYTLMAPSMVTLEEAAGAFAADEAFRFVTIRRAP